MNAKTKVLGITLATLIVVACGRHKSGEPMAQPEAPNAAPASAPAALPVEPPKVNEPQPKVSKDSATQKLFAGQLSARSDKPVYGTALILKTDDGYAIRIEGLHVDDDLPAIDVVLTTHAVNNAEDTAKGMVVGQVKCSTGNMNYALNAEFDPVKYQALSLVVHGQNILLATASFGLM